jgi:hypothetical protein
VTSRLAARRRTSTDPIRSSDVCFPNSRLRSPVLAGSRHCPRDLRLARSDGFWDPPRDRGRGRTRCVRDLRFGVPHWPLIRGVQPCREFYPPTRPMRPTSSISVASPAPVSLDLFGHAFAWVLPGGSCRDRSYRCRVNSNGGVRSEMDSMDRGLFASTRLAPHLGTCAHRAASGILAHPHARRLHRRWPGTETAVGAPTHRSRFSRRLFHP